MQSPCNSMVRVSVLWAESCGFKSRQEQNCAKRDMRCKCGGTLRRTDPTNFFDYVQTVVKYVHCCVLCVYVAPTNTHEPRSYGQQKAIEVKLHVGRPSLRWGTSSHHANTWGQEHAYIWTTVCALLLSASLCCTTCPSSVWSLCRYSKSSRWWRFDATQRKVLHALLRLSTILNTW